MTQEEKLAKLKSGEWRALLETEARTWLYTPYLHKGRVKGVGVDCGGILYELYNPWLGPFKPFPDNYPPDWALHKEGHEIYLDFVMDYVEEIEEPVAGGFSLFHYGRNYSHAAIFTAKGTYIHAYGNNRTGSVRESRPSFFTIGKTAEKPREAKHFDVSKAWLSSLFQHSSP